VFRELMAGWADCKNRIAGVVNFVNGNLRPVKSETDPDLSSWYKRHSLVYVANDHACWGDEELTKKVNKKRFGGVKRSTQKGLNRMMEEHADEVHEWISERMSLGKSGNTTEEDK
jgi:histone deacetylase 6